LEKFAMKKTLIALAALAATASFAQSTVTLGGILEISPFSNGKVTTQAATAAGAITEVKSSRTSSPTTWSTSVLSLTGTEDLGGGLKANFLLLNGVGAGTGVHTIDSTTNAGDSGIGNRARSLGLSGDFGALNFGRFVPAAAAGFHAYSGSGSATFVGNIYGMSTANTAAGPSGLHTSADNFERINNIAQYTSPVFSGFTLNLAVAQNSNDSSAAAAVGKNSTSQTSISLNYAQGPLSVGVGMNDLKTNIEAAAAVAGTLAADGVSVATLGTNAVANSSRKGDLDWIGASYDLGVATVYGTHVKRKATATTAAGVTTTLNSVKVNSFGVMVPMGAVTLRASMYSGKDTRGAGDDTDNMKLSGHQLSAAYALSKRTSLIAAAGTNQYKRDAASVAATRKQSATTMTVNHTF
jgi:predicted porin